MKILRIVLQITAFVFVFGYPSKMDNHVNIFLSKKVSITVNKSHPSYVAYDAVNIKRSASVELNKQPLRVIQLSTDIQEESEVLNHFHPLAKRMLLNPIIIKKDVEVFDTQAVNENYIRHTNLEDIQSGATQVASPFLDQKNWVAEFKPYFRKKVQEGAFSANWTQGSGNGNPNMGAVKVAAAVKKAKDSFVTFGPVSTPIGSSKNFAPQRKPTAEEVVVEKSGYASASATFDEGPSANRIVGIFEIQKGLLYSNEDRIEIRRYEEGVFREKGSINLHDSTYEIFPNDFKGFLLGRMIDKYGKIKGEGVVRVSDSLTKQKGTHQGPKITLVVKSDVNGRAVSSYNINNKNALSQPAKASIFQGQMEKPVGKNGLIKFDNIVKNSPTNLVTETKGHFAAQQIILAGENFSMELIPEKMGAALKQMVSDLKQQNFNDPNLSIVMGKVTFDGQPVSGVSLKVENENELEPIYFNSLMLPDTKLTTTSENGYYAFIIEGGDLITLMALRGDKYFGHINTVVSPGMSSFVEIKNTIKTESVEIKVYEPFTGAPEFSDVALQGQQDTITIEKGVGEAQLPYLGRWSFLYSNPSDKYLPAHYTYVENSDYIYVPVVSKEWVSYLFSNSKLTLYPGTNLVFGFVVDEDFEVDVPGLDQIKNHIVYFDYSGKPTNRGTQGGGFALYNLPEGVYEPLVFGTQSQKIYSRIAPLKTGDVFIFTYKLDGSI
ncbi:MAG: hypothetical protein B7Y39_18705 [Bdellovibrio sp. 28-41-41]|nr:MAG: hypothetical protein B7Y39_18705 [Bdellovibrio sp. 28-41-41]